MLLVAGGQHDPNLKAIIKAARIANVATLPLLIGEASSPSVIWDLNSGEFSADGKWLNATAAFTRLNVFGSNNVSSRQRAYAWHYMLQGWLASSPEIRVLNRAYIGRQTLKPEMLLLAREFNLLVPDTIVTNEISRVRRFHNTQDAIAKPVGGGGLCRVVADIIDETELREGVTASPAIVQNKLQGPDVRVYTVGDRCLGFQIQSDGIDYRMSGISRIDRFTDLPKSTMDALSRLLAALGLEWAATDFKVDESTGDLVFLEINSNPMFSVFDDFVDSQISNSILHSLAISN
jgi:hypothetical protein